MGEFSNGLAVVQDKGKLYYINMENEIVIEPDADIGHPFGSDGYATVLKNEKSGVIDMNGNYILEPIYDSLR